MLRLRGGRLRWAGGFKAHRAYFSTAGVIFLGVLRIMRPG